MQSNNNINLVGYVGQKPILRRFDNGGCLTEISLATSTTYRDRQGQKQSKTQWHKVVAYNKSAEALERYLDKGSLLSVNGTLEYDKWTDKANQPRTTAKIHLASFTFLSGNDRKAEDRGHYPEPAHAAGHNAAPRHSAPHRQTGRIPDYPPAHPEPEPAADPKVAPF